MYLLPLMKEFGKSIRVPPEVKEGEPPRNGLEATQTARRASIRLAFSNPGIRPGVFVKRRR